MSFYSENPLIVQSDLTMLLEVNSSLFKDARNAISAFSELVKSPDYVHTYRITPISLWNAATAGIGSDEVIDRLNSFSKYEIASNVLFQIRDLMARYGQLVLEKYNNDFLIFSAKTSTFLERLNYMENINYFFEKKVDDFSVLIKNVNRGLIKQALIKEGFPVLDKVGFNEGAELRVLMRDNIELRDYQKQANDSFVRGGSHLGGSGVIVLPCGAGKTVVAMGIMSEIKMHTLILVTGQSAVKQWKRELLDKTFLREDQIGEFSGQHKEIKPVTIMTYQILTHRKNSETAFTHFDTVNKNPWGLVIYDEVHLLPAQIFRFSASLQAIRRLGLTATLVREDKKEADVFSLIGPKSYDMGWREVEKKGWIAEAFCHEIRVPIDPEIEMEYVTSPKRQRFRIVSENPAKTPIVSKLLNYHKGKQVLIIGQYVNQLEKLARNLHLPIITGKTRQAEREVLFSAFRKCKIKTLIVSSVANFSIDLPEASIAIQISGKFGSRQEEAQRLGRILRPKKDGRSALFYTVVTEDTEEQEFALNRQLFLTEQGYDYEIVKVVELDDFLAQQDDIRDEVFV